MQSKRRAWSRSYTMKLSHDHTSGKNSCHSLGNPRAAPVQDEDEHRCQNDIRHHNERKGDGVEPLEIFVSFAGTT